MLAEHAAGASYRELGRKHKLHHEQARRIVLPAGRALIAELTADLEADGSTTILVPYGQEERAWRDAHVMLTWSLERLRRNGLEIEVRTYPSDAGVAFQLTIARRTEP
jgi:hypothetical protein